MHYNIAIPLAFGRAQVNLSIKTHEAAMGRVLFVVILSSIIHNYPNELQHVC